MSRVVAAVACGLALAACSMSMPSFDMFKSGPPTEVLRIESEPPGADARTTQGQTCRTPCELTLTTDGELAVTVQMAGYQPQTLPVRADGRGDAKLQPNPLYVELQPAAPVKPAKPTPATPKKHTTAAAPPPAPRQTQAAAPSQGGAYPSGQGYPWPPAPQ
ncbi:MAG TPA: PEGA domain-containing protein [Xanthobacteraceae bacterium]